MYKTYPPYYPLTPDNHAAVVVIAALISLIYAILALTIKFFIRLNVSSIKDFDIVLFVGNVLYVAQTACVLVACNNGLGKHRDAISEGEFERFSQAIYASHILAVIVFGCAKLSVCLLIRQLSNHGWLRRANQFLAGLLIVWTISGSLATVFQCSMPNPWNSEDCAAAKAVYIYNGVMNIVTDIALCALPIAMMLEVQTTTNRKFVVIILFGCRIVTVAATIPSLVHFEPQSDSTWTGVPRETWFQVSLGLSTITACIPSLKSVIDSYLGGMGRATVQGAYALTRSGNESGLTAVRVPGESRIGSGTGGNRSSGVRASVGAVMKGRGDKDRGQEENESVEGLTTAREENDRELASRFASDSHSRGSSVVDDIM